jgi:threonine/homoserine/homoserine lactone efflux protein
MEKSQAARFGLGAVASTLFFLSLVALLGSALKQFLPDIAVQVLNAAVGALLIFFGIRMIVKKKKA